MTGPVPTPLDLPPGDPAVLDDLVGAVTGAAFRTGVLAAHLAGPAATAPGWLGADAAAAADQVGRVTDLVRGLHGTLTAGVDRLRAHAVVLGDVHRRVEVLRRQQEEDFTALAARRPALADPDTLGPAGAELAAAEAARRREHGALLAEVEADAAATAAVLAGTVPWPGGTGAPGQEAGIRAHLAGLLPGWGDGEMVALAWSAVRALDGPVTAEDLDAAAREGLPYASNPAYAGALLAGLGVDGVRHLLLTLGRQPGDPAPPLARWLALAFGAARGDAVPGALEEVLDARFVDPDDPDALPDQVAAGLALLVGAVPAAAGGVRPATVAAWTGAVLAREHRQGVTTASRLGAGAPDVVPLLLDRVAGSADPAAAAVLLAERDAWSALLARHWPDGGALADVVGAAAAAPGPEGGAAVAAGLAALGSGLSPAEPGMWTVDRTTAAVLAPALGAALGAQVDVVTSLLAAAAAGGPLTSVEDESLRGLGYLTVDEDAAAGVAAAVGQRAAGEGAAGAAVVGAFLATREYGQRLDHALDAVEVMTAAVDRRITWEITVGLPTTILTEFLDRTPVGRVASEVVQQLEGLAAEAVDADGSWEVPPDEGLVVDREQAAGAAAGPGPGDAAAEARERALDGFDRTGRILGVPELPRPDEALPWEQLPTPADGLRDLVEDGRRGGR